MSTKLFRIIPLNPTALLIEYNQQPSKVLLEKLLSFNPQLKCSFKNE